jgi:hypothetical protein
MSRLWTTTEENLFTDRTVLLAVRSLWVDPLTKIVEEEGGHPISIAKVEEVFSFLKFEQPEFVILSEDMSQEGSPPNPLLAFIQNMPTSQRREIFVVWIGSNIKSGDMLAAFSYSVNLVLQPEQLPAIAKTIKKSWGQWKDLYQIFLQSHRQMMGL